MYYSKAGASNLLLSILSLSVCMIAPARAQYEIPFEATTEATTVDEKNSSADLTSSPTKTVQRFSYPTANQQIGLQPTASARLSPSIGPVGLNGLPPCTMDSFVRSAGSSADLIYGDEGTTGPPPYYEFTQMHRIESGIHGGTKVGLSTGHRSNLPSAWGADEFLGAEWYRQSGASTYDTAADAAASQAVK